MERQNTASPPSASAISPPSGSSSATLANNNATSTPKIGNKRRKRKHQNWVLFCILRSFAVLGPLGFAANIIYFQIYMHKSEFHLNFHELHPLYEFTKDLGDRIEHYRQELSAISSDGVSGRSAISGRIRSRSSTAATMLSGFEVLERLQEQVEYSWQQCGSSVKSTVALTKQLQNETRNQLRASASKEGSLTPFGLRQTLGKYLKENEAQISASVNATDDALLKQKQQQQQDQQLSPLQCRIPQLGSTECDATTYSIIVTFQGETNFRPLFMNLLSWLTYSSVSDIAVMMPHADWRFEGQTIMDAKYKDRIKSWHESRDHKVSMIGLPPKLDPNPSSKFSLESIVARTVAKLSSKAILFMDGSVLWDGNNRGLQAGFELWKQNPHGMIASHKLNAKVPPSMCPRQSQITTDLDSLWAPFCQVSGGIPDEIQTLHQQYQNIIDMNGVFLHKDMLCLVLQPPISTMLLEEFWPSLDDGNKPHATMVYIRSMLAMAFLQLSGSPPLLFPPRIARPINETKAYNNNWHYLPPQKEAEALDSVTADNTVSQQTALISMLGYFGAGLSAASATNGINVVVPYWCAVNKDPKEAFFMSDIPWMQKGHGDRSSSGKC